ncbi:MAG: HEAT repeat domain-containing protein [Thermoanaerobaculia bacterium]
MECRQALKVRDLVLVRLAGSQALEEDMAFLASHLASCAACQAEAAGIESVWARLGDDDGADLAPSAAFVARTSAALSDASRENVVPFGSRRATDGLLKAAALLLAGGLGFLVGRSGVRPLALVGPAALPTPNGRGENVALVSNRTVDASRAVLDLSGKPRLANATYRAAEEPGKIAVSFDVTTRYTVVGRPENKGVADLLVSLMSGAAETEGARGRVLDFVSATTREGAAVSPEVVNLLRRTLEADKNPSVRKKAAEALVQMPPTPEIRDALAHALKTDANPAVRILAVEGLAKSATVLKDQTTIETLRQKAGDDRENGYVRSQAALALKRLEI